MPNNYRHTLEHITAELGVPLSELQKHLEFNDGKTYKPFMVDVYLDMIQRAVRANAITELPRILQQLDGNFFANSPLKMKLKKRFNLFKDGMDTHTHAHN